MLKHYLNIALRGFFTNKLFSFINVFGLALLLLTNDFRKLVLLSNLIA